MSGVVSTVGSKSGVLGGFNETAKAWVRFDGNTLSGNSMTGVDTSYNVASVEDTGAGRAIIHFIKNMKSATSYSISGFATYHGGAFNDVMIVTQDYSELFNTSNVGVHTMAAINSSTGALTSTDSAECCVIVFGE